MKITNLTWLGFFMTLSSLAIAPKTLAINANNISNSADISENIETRLSRISEALKAREKDLPEESNLKNLLENEILVGGFINAGGGWRNGGGGGFLNNRGGGGFLNNRGWGDGGGGFLNRRY
jgi:rSAM-associated Gly-rich repeat protein